VDFDQNLLGYVSQHSGAYAFGPKGAATPFATKLPASTINLGPLVTELYQVFPTSDTSFAKQTIRLFRSPGNQQNVSGFFEISFEIGVLPSHLEVITLFNTSIASENFFHTDDNGFEFLSREGLFNLGIEGNYYPVIYAAFIRDDAVQLSVISERSHGASSLDEGNLEVMLHRNPDMGDGFGPGLTDTDIVSPVLRVIVDSPSASPIQVRIQPYLLNFPLTVFTGQPSSVVDWESKYVTSTQFISSSLPPNVHFLSLYSLDSSTNPIAIFRLTHLFAVGEDPLYSKPVTLDVKALFNYKISSFRETTLTANRVLVDPSPTTIVLNPKDIRTFVVGF